MTAPRETDHLADEALNAVLDGEATSDEDAHARSCAPCSARLERLAAVAAAVGAPVGPAAASEDRRDEAVAAAMATFDTATDDAASAAAPAPLGPPVDLGAARRRRGGRTRTPAWVIGAAAALVLVIGIGAAGGLLSGSDDDSESAVTATQDTGDEARMESAPLSDEAYESLTASGGDLGAIADGSVLRAAVAESLEVARSAEPDSPAPPDLTDEPSALSGPAEQEAAAEAARAPACEESAAGVDAGGPLRYVASASFEDRPAIVYAFEGPRPADPLEVVLLTVDDCEVRLREQVTAGG
jgi:hypothetical protein